MYVCVWICACECRCPQGSEEGAESLGAGVTSICELLALSAGTWASLAIATSAGNCKSLLQLLFRVLLCFFGEIPSSLHIYPTPYHI